MKTSSSPKTRLTDQKKAAILEAAVRDFIEYGFDHTSMDQIAESAQVSKRTVYNHFASKDALFDAIVGELISRADVLPDFPYESAQSIEKQLQNIGLQITQTVSNECFLNLAKVVVARAMHAPEFAKILAERTQMIDTKFADWLRLAVKDKRLKLRQPHIAAEEFLSMLLSYAFWPRLLGIKKRRHEQSDKDFVAHCVKMFVSLYGV